MLDTAASPPPDRRPAIVICAYEADETRWDPIEDLSGVPWSPTGARTVALQSAEVGELVEALSQCLPDCRGVLLLGRGRDDSRFTIQLRAERREPDLARRGPSIVRATAPAAEMAQALREGGLEVEISSEGEDDAGNRLLHHLLNHLPDPMQAPSIGLLRLPAQGDEATVTRGVKLAAAVMARHLAPMPRLAPA